jgi:acetolactate synthase-1/2/3 large subunit
MAAKPSTAKATGNAPAATPVTATPSSIRRAAGPEVLTGAEAIVRSLEKLEVDTVFGLPGGTILPDLRPAVRDRQDPPHPRPPRTGRRTRGRRLCGRLRQARRVHRDLGPGATNLITALADAHMDSVPMLAITGQQASNMLGTDAFQEADIVGMTMPVTKHSFLVTKAEDIPTALINAHHIATTGRPGPVLVDITKDAQTGTVPFVWPEEPALPGYRPILKPHAKQIREAARMISESQRPVFYIGGGVIRSEAEKELLRLAEATNIPVVTTLMARGAFPDSHQLHLGMPGMHGSVPAVTAFQKADLLIAIGARFDDRVTGRLDSFAPNAQVIHADIDPAEIGKNRDVEVAIVGDAREVLAELLTEMRGKFPKALERQREPGGASSTGSSRPIRWAMTGRTSSAIRST